MFASAPAKFKDHTGSIEYDTRYDLYDRIIVVNYKIEK